MILLNAIKGENMKIESLITQMMTVNVRARLWHWTTDNAQHHVTYENFLTQNELFTDSLVESALGNDRSIDFTRVGVKEGTLNEYKHSETIADLKAYRSVVAEAKAVMEKEGGGANLEFITVLDNVTENISKSLYLLRLK
jgi:hypothetical protein